MSRFLLSWVPHVALALLCSCGHREKLPVDAGDGPDWTAQAGPPAVGSLPLPLRHVSATRQTALLEADVVAQHDALFTPQGLELSTALPPASPAYVVYGLTVTDGQPARIDIHGGITEVYVAVSDFSTGRWRFLGDAWNSLGYFQLRGQCVLIDLPPGPQYTDATGKFYVAFVVPAGYGGLEEADISLHIADNTGDNDPPVWTGGEGVAGVSDPYPFTVQFHAISDPNSPVDLLLYVRPAVFPIDWRFPAEQLDAAAFADGYGITYDASWYLQHYAARARDAAGNITTNTNYVDWQTTMPQEDPPPLLGYIAPGDQLVLSWDDPAANLDLDVLAPNTDEAARDIPELAGRSFIVGPNSMDTGLPEERVQLQARPPDGDYIVIVQWNNGPVANVAPRLRLLWPHGGLKHDYGVIPALGSQGERDVAVLYYPRP